MIIKVNVILMEEVEFDKDSYLKEELDNSWVEEFEEQDSIYKDFYKEQVQTVKIILFYIWYYFLLYLSFRHSNFTWWRL